jgi:hypothetical protein
MSSNDKVTIWGGVPRFGTAPTTGQAIVGGGNGFVIYDSAKDNTSVVVIPGNTPLPNKNMEIAQKTVAGVTTQYYGFAGYCSSYYSTATQTNLAGQNLVSFNSSSIQYGIYLSGSPTTRMTVFSAGVYKISGTLDFRNTDALASTSITITLSGTAPLTSNSAPVSVGSVTVTGPLPETNNVSAQTANLTGIGANLSSITTTALVSWADVALETYLGVWIRKNGVDVAWTKRAYSMIGSGNARLVVNIDYTLDLNDNDYVELVWESANSVATPANTSLYSAGANFPSALINMNMVR